MNSAVSVTFDRATCNTLDSDVVDNIANLNFNLKYYETKLIEYSNLNKNKYFVNIVKVDFPLHLKMQHRTGENVGGDGFAYTAGVDNFIVIAANKEAEAERTLIFKPLNPNCSSYGSQFIGFTLLIPLLKMNNELPEKD